MTMMLMIMLTVIIGMKMHEYDNDGDDGDEGDDLFFSELSIHVLMCSKCRCACTDIMGRSGRWADAAASSKIVATYSHVIGIIVSGELLQWRGGASCTDRPCRGPWVSSCFVFWRELRYITAQALVQLTIIG